MKKQEMTETLQSRGQELTKELTELQQQVTLKREQLLRIEGALEALGALESDDPGSLSVDLPGDENTEGAEE